jgi:hypothetical protein
LALAVCAGAATAHPHGFLVYQDAASGQLRIDFDWAMAHHVDDVIPGVPGLAAAELSFEEIVSDPHEPHADPSRAPIAAGAKIVAVFTSFDAGVSAYDPADLLTPIDTPGQTFGVGTGGTDFDRAIIWSVNPAVPGFDHHAHHAHVSFFLRDVSGTHADSVEYTLALAPVPAPGAGVLLGALGLAAARRRRHRSTLDL